MNRYKPVGWRNESMRHSLARKGIKTVNQCKNYKVVGAGGRKVTKEYMVYSFDDLPKEAKEKALEQYRDINTEFDDWYKPIEEDLIEDLEEQGFSNIETYYSGFWSQGDGASFKGTLDVDKYIEKNKLQRDYPEIWKEIQKGEYYIGAGITQDGNYAHENTMSSYTEYEGDNEKVEKELEKFENDLLVDMRDKAIKYYGNLRNYFNESQSDEAVAETLRINEYEFTEDGKIHN